MGNLLVVEPYKMLQQAIACTLAVEHKIRIEETFPDGGIPAGYDAVIIDAAALREKGGLGDREQRAAQAWQTPILWIEGNSGPAAPKRDRIIALRRPVERDALLKALAECLRSASADKLQAAPAAKKAKTREAKKAKETSAAVPIPAEPEIIELTEVVEETSVAEENRPQET